MVYFYKQMTDKEKTIKELMTIPSIGKSISSKLYAIGIRKISDLKNKDPEEIFFKCCAKDNEQHCRCFLYTIRCAVYYASTKNPDPALLRWNSWGNKNKILKKS
jgi:hypothetical protein